MMKIENFPEFLCTVHEDPICEFAQIRQLIPSILVPRITAVAIPWENCEYVPARVDETSCQINYPFPVKFLKRPKNWFFSRTVLAVRTDVYPLWWIYVWLYLQGEFLAHNVWCWFMWHCNRLGIAKTKPGSHYCLADFAIKPQSILSIVSWILVSVTAVSWFLSKHPYVGAFWLILWGWVQFRVWQDKRSREKLIEELQSHSQALKMNVCKDTAFVHDFEDNLIPAFPKKLLGEATCLKCKYFYGKQNIVCAVHPSGHEGEDCKDFSNA